MLKKAITLLFVILGAVSLARAQSTTVSGQVTDAGGQSWNNGTVTAQFVPNPLYVPQPLYTWTGGALNITINGALNATGGYSIAIPSNSAISPQGSFWRFQFCPQAAAACFTTANVTITGGTQTVNATPPAILVNAGSGVNAYADAEVAASTVGLTYFNLTLAALKICTALPCSSNWSAMSNSSGGTFTGPVTINNPTPGGNDLTLGLLDRIRIICGQGPPPTYRLPTFELGIADINANATQGGLIEGCPDNATDSPAAPVNIGSATQGIVVELHPGNTWSYNVSSAQTAAWELFNQGTIEGANLGSVNAAVLQIGCLANLTYGLDDASGHSGAGANSAIVANIFLRACATGTVGAGSPSTALFNWEAISNPNEIRNVYLYQFPNTIGFRFASNSLAGSAEGPFACTNCWANGQTLTGAQPFVVTATGGRPILPLSFNTGAALDPAAGGIAFNLDGNNQTYGTGTSVFFPGQINGYYTENLAGSAITHFHLEDISGWHIFSSGGLAGSSNTDTYFDISQRTTGLTCDLTFENIRAQNGGTFINNHITALTQSMSSGVANWLSFYHFGGASHGCTVTPVIIDDNKLQILNTTGVAELIKNNADSELDSDLDCGTTAVQSCYHRYLDRGTVEWEEGKASNIYRVTDVVNNQVHFAGVQASQTFVSGFGAGPVELNDSTGSSGLVDFWNAGGTIKTGEVDASANIFFGCHTTTFQNCTELTAPNAAGGASAAVMTWPATGGTVMVTGQNSAQKTQRFGASCTTAASAQATCTSTFSWTTAFGDANYTPVCWGEGPSGSPILTLSATQIAASVTVQVQNAAAAASSFAGVYCSATHD